MKQWKVEADLLWKVSQPREIPNSYVGVMPPNREEFDSVFKMVVEKILEDNDSRY